MKDNKLLEKILEAFKLLVFCLGWILTYTGILAGGALFGEGVAKESIIGCITGAALSGFFTMIFFLYNTSITKKYVKEKWKNIFG